jgi:2-polyprenyl-6-hydroxyphenyl methylase/3-demethylubiquinone-9 3-methyltransferase
MEVVEHGANLQTFLNACVAVVRPGGAMFVATINRTLVAYLSAIIGAEYILRSLPKGTHRYSMLRKPSEIIHFLAKNGLECKEQIGVGANPFTRNFSFRENTNINYMLFAQKNKKNHF